MPGDRLVIVSARLRHLGLRRDHLQRRALASDSRTWARAVAICSNRARTRSSALWYSREKVRREDCCRARCCSACNEKARAVLAAADQSKMGTVNPRITA
jgi:hypothetical protein